MAYIRPRVRGNEDIARALSSHLLERFGEADVIATETWSGNSGGGEGLLIHGVGGVGDSPPAGR
jgi:hypothetical protein